MSLKRLPQYVTTKATLTSDMSLKRLPRHITEKATLTCHWKGYPDMSLKRLRWWETCHWKGYPNMSLKRLPQHVIYTFQWCRLCSGLVCCQIIYTLHWLHVHWHRALLQLLVTMSLYKDMSSYNAPSHFNHILSLHSRTTLLNMPRYLIPSWNDEHFATVVTVQRLPPLWCRPHMDEDVSCIKTSSHNPK
jgi:hypothetical protein